MLLDWKIGGGKAFDSLKKVNPKVKVLLSSGYSIDGKAKEILNRGCDAFIQKPFNIEQLSQNIREILNKGYTKAYIIDTFVQTAP